MEREPHETPAEAGEGKIVGRPTMLAKFEGRLDHEQVLRSLERTGYPLEDVSVLFRPEGSDQVVDLTTGHVAAGQSLTDEEIERRKLEKGQTVVLLHPTTEQVQSVNAALAEIGTPEIEYSGETHAHGQPGGVVREDEQPA
jgi:hypothetical protein